MKRPDTRETALRQARKGRCGRRPRRQDDGLDGVADTLRERFKAWLAKNPGAAQLA